MSSSTFAFSTQKTMHELDEDMSPPLTPGMSTSSAGKDGALDRRSAWGSAKVVLHGVKAAGRFSTLRDLVGTDAYVDESRLKMVKALGGCCQWAQGTLIDDPEGQMCIAAFW